MAFKKGISFLLALVLLFGTMLHFCAFADETSEDNIGPKVSSGNSIQLFMGQTSEFVVSAYDESELSDDVLTPDDFTVYAYGLSVNPVAKVVAVSEPYKSEAGSRFTCWTVTIKGLLPGKASLQVRKETLYDVHGNGSSYSTAMIVRNGGLLSWLRHCLYEII